MIPHWIELLAGQTSAISCIYLIRTPSRARRRLFLGDRRTLPIKVLQVHRTEPSDGFAIYRTKMPSFWSTRRMPTPTYYDLMLRARIDQESPRSQWQCTCQGGKGGLHFAEVDTRRNDIWGLIMLRMVTALWQLISSLPRLVCPSDAFPWEALGYKGDVRTHAICVAAARRIR